MKASYHSHEESHLTAAQIQICVEGKADSVLNKHLKECRKCFGRYFSMKEAYMMLDSAADKATPAETQAVLSMVHGQNRNHVRIILRFVKDRVLLSSSGQEQLDFQGFEASFNYRGDSLQGPVSITRTIGDRKITIVLTPDKTTGQFLVSVALSEEEKLQVTLFSEGNEIETILDLTKQKMFDAAIPARGVADLIFKKDREELCTINLILKSDPPV